jgi:predicted PhzF superfamily epimerase YddE/YHI9
MTTIAFVQVDAFANRPFTGNPAAVMPLEHWLDDAVMQAIAAENNLAETAFYVPTSGDADYELRWFTPAVEVVLCGHATLASGHVVLSSDPSRQSVRFRTRQRGVLEVRRATSGYELDLPALPPSPSDDRRSADAVGVTPVATLFREGGYFVTVLESEAELRALKPDFRALGLAVPGDPSHIFTAPGAQTDFVSRMFAPNAGIDEDPVTGSAHAVLTPYWAERLGKTELTAFQASARGGHVACRLAGDRVVLGGPCITVIEGQFRL